MNQRGLKNVGDKRNYKLRS